MPNKDDENSLIMKSGSGEEVPIGRCVFAKNKETGEQTYLYKINKENFCSTITMEETPAKIWSAHWKEKLKPKKKK